jgi:hypothetical protein
MIIYKVGLPVLITTVIPLTVAKESKSCEECESAIHAAVNFRLDQVISGNIKGHTSDVKEGYLHELFHNRPAYQQVRVEPDAMKTFCDIHFLLMK